MAVLLCSNITYPLLVDIHLTFNSLSPPRCYQYDTSRDVPNMTHHDEYTFAVVKMELFSRRDK